MIKHLPPRKLSKRELKEYEKTNSTLNVYDNWPHVRRLRLISQNLISVQPMPPPLGILNYLEYKFNNEYEEDDD